jgi:hypothetical protein
LQEQRGGFKRMNGLISQSNKDLDFNFSGFVLPARHSPKKISAAVKLNAARVCSGGCAVPKMPDKRPDCQIVNFADAIPRNKKNIPNIFIILPYLKVRFLPVGFVISSLARAVPSDLNVKRTRF